MRLQPLWPTKIILRLLAANLSTTANQLSATSVLIQQNQHGDYKQNDMASFAKTLYKAPTKSERNVFFLWVTVDFLIHSEQYANTCMAVLITRVTCKSFFFSFWERRKVLSCEIYLRGLRPCFFHGGAIVLFYLPDSSRMICTKIAIWNNFMDLQNIFGLLRKLFADPQTFLGFAIVF